MSATLASPDYLVSDLVGMALQQLGVGVSGNGIDPNGVTSGVMHLNMMLAQWQRRRWMVPALAEFTCISNGNVAYAVGNGGDIAPGIMRPDQIDSVFVRWTQNIGFSRGAAEFGGDFDSEFSTVGTPYANPLVPGSPLALDHPLYPIPSREDYSDIRVKGLQTWPAAFYYSPDFPQGSLYVWPVPLPLQWEIHVVCKVPLPCNLTAATPIALPPEYADAIMWSLAARLAPSYGAEASQTVVLFARAALQTIRGANTQVRALQMPGEIMPRWGASWGWWFGAGGASPSVTAQTTPVGPVPVTPTPMPVSPLGIAALGQFSLGANDLGTPEFEPGQFNSEFDIGS